jgi:outer membrane protein assembly factor BamB
MTRLVAATTGLLCLALCRTSYTQPAWPMLGHNASRSGATTDEVRPPFARKWYRAFPDEGILAGVQPVVADGLVLVGTLRGVLHAIDAETGADKWSFRAGGAILHSCAAGGGNVFFGAADGKLYAVALGDGKPAWSVPTGAAVWNAPAFHNGVVYVGSRDGKLYAIGAKDGTVKWSALTGGPQLNSPAIDAKAGRIYVASEDMHAYSFGLAGGKQIWKSDKLPGVSFRGYHPVVTPDASVVVTAQPGCGYDEIQQVMLDMVKEVFGDFASWRHKKDENDRLRKMNFEQFKDPQTYPKQIAYLRKRLTEQPAYQTLFVLDGNTGNQKFVAPVVAAESMNGPCSPPVVTPEGKVIVKFSALLRSRYEHYSPFLNVGYLDTATGDVTPLMDPSRTYGWHDSLLLVHDEQSQLAVAGRLLINTHQDNVNAMDLDTLKGYPQPLAVNVHEPPAGAAVGVWAEHLSGRPLPQGWEWFARGTAAYGGGSAIDVPVAVAGNSFYYLPTHEINAGVAVIAYRMDKNGKGHERGPVPKEMLTDGQWQTVRTSLKWDWDTLGMPRLDHVLKALPGSGDVPGTRRKPLAAEANEAVTKITDEQIDALVWEAMRLGPAKDDPQVAGLRDRLARAVDELVSTEWRPLLFPAAKAPAEAYRFFTEPTETLYTFALAYPHLPPDVQGKVKARVAKMAERGGPLEGPTGRKTYDAAAGAVRSLYDPPPEKTVRVANDFLRSDTARLYPLWLWAHTTGDWAKLKSDWPRIRGGISDKAPDNKPEPDCGNGRVAGLIAACRIARALRDEESVNALLPGTRRAIRDRLVYELSHSEGGVITSHGSRTIFGRWRHLTPEVARLCATYALPTQRRLMDVYVDHHRPTWWLAWNVDLMWRNEAPMSFPTMAQEVFAARAMLLGEKPQDLHRYLDIPWCRGDETYVQKLALLLNGNASVFWKAGEELH